MLQDRYGLPVSASSTGALAALVETSVRCSGRSRRSAEATALLGRRLDRRPTVPLRRSA